MVRKQPDPRRRSGSGVFVTPDPSPSSTDPAEFISRLPWTPFWLQEYRISEEDASLRASDERRNTREYREYREYQEYGLSNTTWFDAFWPVRAKRAALLALPGPKGSVWALPWFPVYSRCSRVFPYSRVFPDPPGAVPLEFPYCFRSEPASAGDYWNTREYTEYTGIPWNTRNTGNTREYRGIHGNTVIRPVGPLASNKARRAVG